MANLVPFVAHFIVRPNFNAYWAASLDYGFCCFNRTDYFQPFTSYRRTLSVWRRAAATLAHMDAFLLAVYLMAASRHRVFGSMIIRTTNYDSDLWWSLQVDESEIRH